MAKLEGGTEKERGQKIQQTRNQRVKERNQRVKSVEKGKEKVEAVETREEDICEKEKGRETRSGGSDFMPRIDNLDVKSYIRRMCLSVTY